MGWGVSECSGRLIFISFIKENWICAITRHRVELNHGDIISPWSNINILLTKNLPFDSDVRQ